MQFGYGIEAYKIMLWAMICTFCVFSLLALPVILIYKQGECYAFGYQKLEENSLGNLGYSTIQCQQIPVGIGILTL